MEKTNLPGTRWPEQWLNSTQLLLDYEDTVNTVSVCNFNRVWT